MPISLSLVYPQPSSNLNSQKLPRQVKRQANLAFPRPTNYPFSSLKILGRIGGHFRDGESRGPAAFRIDGDVSAASESLLRTATHGSFSVRADSPGIPGAIVPPKPELTGYYYDVAS